MNRDEAIQRAEIAMAWARGEVVQYRDGNFDWRNEKDCDGKGSPLFFDSEFQWRIKRKPLECWVWVPDEQLDLGPSVTLSSSISFRGGQPRTPPASRCMPGRWVRMREVE